MQQQQAQQNQCMPFNMSLINCLKSYSNQIDMCQTYMDQLKQCETDTIKFHGI